MTYALEKLGLAIYDLTVGEEDIKQRLSGVTKYLAVLSENDFPESLRGDWNSIISRLTKKESLVKGTKYDEGNFEATLFGMHKSTASKIAVEIVNIHEQLVGHIEDGLWP